MLQFNRAQIDRLSEIISNLSLVTFASLVLPVFSQQYFLELPTLLLGSITSFGGAIISLVILKGVNS